MSIDKYGSDLTGAWRTGARCDSASCVEVAVGPDVVTVRDSATPTGPQLRFTRAEWTDFLDGVKSGKFDLA